MSDVRNPLGEAVACLVLVLLGMLAVWGILAVADQMAGLLS